MFLSINTRCDLLFNYNKLTDDNPGFGFPDLVNYCGFGFFAKSEIQPVTHQRVRKNMACLKNDWFPIHKDDPNIMKEAGMFSIKKRDANVKQKELNAIYKKKAWTVSPRL